MVGEKPTLDFWEGQIDFSYNSSDVESPDVTNASMLASLVEMRADWLQSMMLVLALDLSKFHNGFSLHDDLNWRWGRFWESNSDS